MQKKFNFNLEALRGVAAFIVVLSHPIIHHHLLDIHYQPDGIWTYVAPSHTSVLLFFVLSGYVIGMAHDTPLTKFTILPYLKKRAVRIYPIYLICIALALLIATHTYSTNIILSHLTMTQVLLSPLIYEINPVWSLNYEVLFYLLFIPLSALRINPIPVALLCILIGCVDAYLSPRLGTPLVSSYAFGFAFWLSGLALARHSFRPAQNASYALMVSLLFLLLSIEKFNILSTILSKGSKTVLGTELLFPESIPFGQRAILFQDFAYLPFCLITLLTFASKDFAQRKLILFLLICAPSLTFYSLYKHFDATASMPLLVPCLFYILALITYGFQHQIERGAQAIIKRLVASGSISYGLYIVHFPILILFSRMNFFSGSIPVFATRFILYILLSAALAYWLEKKYQPWAKKLIG